MSVRDLTLLFLPEEAIPLAVAILAMGVIVGLVPLGKAARFVILLLLLPFLPLLLEQLLLVLPWYAAAALILYLILSVFRGVLELFLGREAAGHVLGSTVIGVVKILGRTAAGVFRLGITVIRALSRLALNRRVY